MVDVRTQSLTSNRYHYLRAVIVAACTSIILFVFYSRSNDFPASYHPDEPSKIDQILTGKRNFNHPQLLLTVTSVVQRIVPDSRNPDSLLSIGRQVSAGMAALAAFCSMLIGYSHRRWVGLAICGLLIGLCPPVFTCAHFFKEDASLLAGMSVCLLGARMLILGTSLWPAIVASILLGVGVGLAASAKYVGLAAALPAIVACILAGNGPALRLRQPVSRPDWSWRTSLARLSIVSLAAVAVFILANPFAFDSYWPPRLSFEASQRFVSEVRHGLGGEKGLALPVPNLFLAFKAVESTLPHFLVFGVLALAYSLFKRSISKTSILYATFLASFALILAFNSIPFARYALPITFLLSVFGAISIATVYDDMWRRDRTFLRWSATVFVFLFTSIQCVMCLQIEDQFRNDSRQSLRQWVMENVPIDSIIVADAYTHLGSPDGDKKRFPNSTRLPMVMRSKQFASDFTDDLATLRQSGVSFVAVSSLTYDRLYVDGVFGKDGSNDLWASRKQFYDALFLEGNLIWHYVPEPRTDGFVSPELRLYDIRGK